MCSYDLTKIHPFPDFIRAIQKWNDRDELHKNDGVVPVFSQWHPLSCQYVRSTPGTIKGEDQFRLMLGCLVLRETKCVHHQALTDSSRSVADDLVSGTWNVFTIDGATHASIVPRWTGSELQTTFFQGLGERLRFIEEEWAAGRAA
jgi:hypothetical protein